MREWLTNTWVVLAQAENNLYNLRKRCYKIQLRKCWQASLEKRKFFLLMGLHLSIISLKVYTFYKFFFHFKFTKILFKASSKSFAFHIYVFILAGIMSPVVSKRVRGPRRWAGWSLLLADSRCPAPFSRDHHLTATSGPNVCIMW